jgi:hypothetical protein
MNGAFCTTKVPGLVHLDVGDQLKSHHSMTQGILLFLHMIFQENFCEFHTKQK